MSDKISVRELRGFAYEDTLDLVETEDMLTLLDVLATAREAEQAIGEHRLGQIGGCDRLDWAQQRLVTLLARFDFDDSQPALQP